MRLYCGLDLGKKTGRYCVMNEARKVVEEGWVKMSSAELTKGFSERPPMKVVVEASTKAFWVADNLSELGHSVVVVDPGRTKAIGSSLIKNDKLDARVLATLCAANVLAEVDRPSAEQRHARMPVVARDALVRSRVKLTNAVRSMLDSEGIEMRSCGTDVFAQKAREVAETIPEGIRMGIEPLLESIELLSKQIAACDEKLKQQSRNDPQVKLLMTAPGVGPVVAMCFMLAIRQAGRFHSSRQVASYFGLVPSLYQSGKTNRRGGITKHGNRQGRWALTVAASHVLRTTKASALRDWGVGLSERVGRKTAVVAVARKLAGVLWSMLKHNRPFEPRLAAAVAN